MLQLSQLMINRPVLSLRTGGVVATATRPIINPNNLKIEGWHCKDNLSNATLVLQATDVRDMLPQGIVVNDHEELVPAHDLVRLQKILDINFELLGKPVITVSKEKVGKVNDYATDLASLFIQKLYVSQSLLKNFAGGGLQIDRSQIVEITNRKIVVQDLLQPTKVMPATAPITT